MTYEEIVVTTPLKRKVKVRMRNLGDDVWDTSLFYANQVRRVGKFKGKDFAIDAAKQKKQQKSPMRRPLPVRSSAATMTPPARSPSLLRMKLPA
jgi:hypothetical protein